MARLQSESFALDEFVFNQAAARLGVDHTSSPEVAANLRLLPQALQQVQQALGCTPILVSSGDRSSALNKAGQGAHNSAHGPGLAVNFAASRFGAVLQMTKAAAAAGAPYGQVTHVFCRWVHLAISTVGHEARTEMLTIQGAGMYTPGLRSRSRPVA